MPRHALVSMLAMSLVLGLASLPAASLADDIKPKAPETAFSGKLRPDILGISTESNAESARAIFDSLFKGRTDTKTDIQQQKFGRRQLRRCVEFQPPRRFETERRDALDQLLLARERQPRLFRGAQSDLRPGPAAVEGRHDQGSHGQIRRAHHRRRSAPVLHLPQGLDHVRRRQVQGSDRAGSDRQAARPEGRRQAQRRHRPRQLRGGRQARADQGQGSRAPCWPRPRARTATAC